MARTPSKSPAKAQAKSPKTSTPTKAATPVKTAKSTPKSTPKTTPVKSALKSSPKSTPSGVKSTPVKSTPLKSLAPESDSEEAEETIYESASDFGSESDSEPVELNEEDLEHLQLLQEVAQLNDAEFDPADLSKAELKELKDLLSQAAEARANMEEEESDEEALDFDKLANSDSDSELEDDEAEAEEEIPEVEEAETEEEDVPLSDVEVDSDADIVPYTKLTINNQAALKDSLARISLPWAKNSFEQHKTINCSFKCETQIKDIYDDTERELVFYKQSLEAALEGRRQLLKLKVPFSRPMDFFAEMLKSDEHMEKLKGKLIQEASAKKASEEAKRQRQLKKFGKQVQNETLQARAKDKRETLDKIKSIKRKRTDNEMTNNEFDVAIEEATAAKDEYADRQAKRQKGGKRAAKDNKFGNGGKKRFLRKNDKESSADMSGFSQRKMKGKTARPGKSKRTRRT